jgi:hypothetical protein
MIPLGPIDITLGDLVLWYGYVAVICLLAALPAAIVVSVVAYRRATHHRLGHALGFGAIGIALTMPPTALTAIDAGGWWAAPIVWVLPLGFAWFLRRTPPGNRPQPRHHPRQPPYPPQPYPPHPHQLHAQQQSAQQLPGWRR